MKSCPQWRTTSGKWTARRKKEKGKPWSGGNRGYHSIIHEKDGLSLLPNNFFIQYAFESSGQLISNWDGLVPCAYESIIAYEGWRTVAPV